jgi:hypothetical protein
MSVSMFDKCPKCSNLIVKGQACPTCRTDPDGSGSTPEGESFRAEYETRRRLHVRNYTIYMVLMMGLGLVSLSLGALVYTSMGGRFAARATAHASGQSISLVMLLAYCGLGVLWVVFSVLLYLRKLLFPIELNCPKCDIRLDEIGMTDDCCPGCRALLR